ncbi:MAG: DUF1285 domain-containing protein [Halieaceae bacterium]|jgi:hypothetical protein|nr:DUF1285 domain-containing protein [Halieaceae bacterium]
MSESRGPELNKSGGLAELARSIGEVTGIAADDVFVGSVNGRKPAPLHLWNPDHCGDIRMEIRSDGTWYHEGTPIRRQELMRLFAGILRRESDGDYYLVTPVEKCRVSVALHPIMVIDATPLENAAIPTIALQLNTGGTVLLDAEHPLALEPRAEGAAYVQLDHGLTALFSRAAWIRFVAMADENGVIESGGARFSLLDA